MNLAIKESQIAGRGVFAMQPISKGELIEVCPVIVLSERDREKIARTYLSEYYFSWDFDRAVIALGYSSLYNHSASPNATYDKHFEDQTIVYQCLRPIAQGEEITVAYHHGPWFPPNNN
ncbi:SET domain-containing protein [bacterium]|nr:SET domain-containing protein [bacterium]